MFNYSQIGGMQIRIFVEANFAEIQNAVHNLPSFDGVEYTTIINEPLPEISSYCDIVILKKSPDVEIRKFKEMMRSRAKLILCVMADEENQIQAEDFRLLDDLWIYPFSPERATLRLRSLVHEILRTQEAQLHKNWLDTLMDLVPDMIWFKSSSGAHLKVNKTFSKIAGKTRRMIEGRNHEEIWGEGGEDCEVSEIEVFNSGEQKSFDEVIIINNTPHHLKTHKAPFRGTNDSIIGTVGVAQDLTSMLNLNLEIGIFMEAMPFPLILTGDDGKVIHANNKFLEMFGECHEDLIGAYYTAWSDWAFEDASDFIGNTFRYAHGEQNLLIQFTETPLTDSFGQPIGMVRAFMDVTAEKEMESRIRMAANLDALTRVASRHGFAQWLISNKPAMNHLIYLDLDNFKYVNDTYGHKAGDDALYRVADCIREVFPKDFVARLGGDEFVVCVCRDLEVPALTELAEALQTRVANCFLSSEEFKNLSLSIGIRPHCEASVPVEKLIREADSAMYKAKESGKARVEIWTPEKK